MKVLYTRLETLKCIEGNVTTLKNKIEALSYIFGKYEIYGHFSIELPKQRIIYKSAIQEKITQLIFKTNIEGENK